MLKFQIPSPPTHLDAQRVPVVIQVVQTFFLYTYIEVQNVRTGVQKYKEWHGTANTVTVTLRYRLSHFGISDKGWGGKSRWGTGIVPSAWDNVLLTYLLLQH